MAISLKKDDNRITVLGAVSSSDGTTIIALWADPVTHRLLVDASGGGGSGFTLLPATGTVNGSNKAFTFTQLPTYIVSDGLWYRQNVGWTWNAGSLTATMTAAPQTDIWGFV